MQILNNSSGNEMISLFLFEEINSEQWKNKIVEIIESNDIDKNIVLKDSCTKK